MGDIPIEQYIHEDDYLRQRIDPKPNDFFYLSLSDLNIALSKFRIDGEIDLLDYGSGGSPYRLYFPKARYKRADYLQASGDRLDYVLNQDSEVSEKDESFDQILSTQVAEHLSNPRKYFSECFRLLRPKGRLICSTHGYFPDHGCPFDFQRWTAEGLARDLRDAGFEVEEMYKLTTGSRAFFSILDFSMHDLRFARNSILGLSVFVLSKLFGMVRSIIYRKLDTIRIDERMVIDKDDQHRFYIGLLAVATKPLTADEK